MLKSLVVWFVAPKSEKQELLVSKSKVVANAAKGLVLLVAFPC